MRLVAVDFDNTIVKYDTLFHCAALADELIPLDLPRSRLRVRDHLRETGRETLWTELQGVVYGARMGEAEPYDGAVEFLTWARAAGLETAIVSHKTRWPYRGPRHDLRAAARDWIAKRLRDVDGALVPPERVFFEDTKEAKLKRIGRSGADCFVDDLPELLLAPDFPTGVERILFDPDGRHAGVSPVLGAFGTWDEIRRHIERILPRPA